MPVSPLSVIILNREFQKCYLLDIACSSYEFGRFIKTGKWVLKIEKATNQAILFELAMVISYTSWLARETFRGVFFSSVDVNFV